MGTFAQRQMRLRYCYRGGEHDEKTDVMVSGEIARVPKSWRFSCQARFGCALSEPKALFEIGVLFSEFIKSML